MSEDRPTISSSRLTATEVARHSFGNVRRGFDPHEVRSFLDSVARELQLAEQREQDLRGQVAAAEERALHPVLDESTLSAALGQQSANVLRAAHEEAARILAAAEESAAAISHQAQRQATEAQLAAEATAARRIADAELAASGIRQQIERESAELLEAARIDGDELLARAREQGRALVERAQLARREVLADLAQRRRDLHLQIEQLRAARDELTAIVRGVRGSVDGIVADLVRADDEARAAAAEVARRPPSEIEGHDEVEAIEEQIETGLVDGVRIDRLADLGPEPDVEAARTAAEPAEPSEHLEARPAEAAPAAQAAAPAGAARVGPADEHDGVAPADEHDGVAPADEHDGVAPADEHGAVGALGEAPEEIGAAGEAGAAPPAGEPGGEGSNDQRAPISGSNDEGAPIGEAPEEVLMVADEEETGAGPGSSADAVFATGPETTASELATAEAREKQSVSELFARIRANARPDRSGSSGDASASAAGALPDQIEDGTAGGEGAGSAAPSAEIGSGEAAPGDGAATDPASADDPAADAAVPGATISEAADAEGENGSDPAALVAMRADLLDPVVARLTRRLKRALQDDQNRLLDAIRSGSGQGDDLGVPEDERRASLVEASSRLLKEAYVAGSTFARQQLQPGAKVPRLSRAGDQRATSAATEEASKLADAVVGQLRRRLSGEGGDQRSDDINERVGAAYREWRGERIERLVADAALGTFSSAVLTATGAKGLVRWMPSNGSDACPDCDDNFLAGSVTPGTGFPTGHAHPPAHPGCRCLVAPTAS